MRILFFVLYLNITNGVMIIFNDIICYWLLWTSITITNFIVIKVIVIIVTTTIIIIATTMITTTTVSTIIILDKNDETNIIQPCDLRSTR